MNTHRTTSTKPQARAEGEREPQRLSAHPHASRVPTLEPMEFAAFCADISERGVLVPLEITAEDVVLDGHIRLRAARALKLERVPVRVVAPDDDVLYMLGAALKRRHLTASQRAALAVELGQYHEMKAAAEMRRLANLKQQDGEVATLPPQGKTRDRAAEWAGVSPRIVQDVASVQAADPKLFDQVKSGRLPAHRAMRQVRQQQRDAALPDTPPLPDSVFDLIYADPPWRLPGSPDSSRAVENHYPTMPLEEIKAIEVPAAEDAILFLWGVNSLTPAALEVIEAWGFTYVTNSVWDKEKIGLGQYNRCQHELLHIARRGKFSPPPEDKRWSSVIRSPRGRHSEKPAVVYQMLEEMYPATRKLELFARTARTGWTAWGNQAPAEDDAA